MLRHRKYH